eukprot:COSAG05_NODE_13292_length_435_cov_0.773810_1_plen_69_part_01
MGYWNGAETYFDHTTGGAFDFVDSVNHDAKARNDTRTAWQYNGSYSTAIFSQRTIELIQNHAGNEDTVE